MTNKFIKQYNYAEMTVLNVKSISLGTGGEHVIQPGNWRRARDAVWELEGST